MLERRRRFIDALESHPLVEDVDFTRDGYQTLVLDLGPPETDADVVGPELEECENCGATGLPERIQDHDCQSFRERRADA